MKNFNLSFILAAFAILALLPLQAFAQFRLSVSSGSRDAAVYQNVGEPIVKMEYKVLYESKYVIDVEKNTIAEGQLLLEIGGSTTKCYNLNMVKRDSISRVLMAQNAPTKEYEQQYRNYRGGLTWTVFSNFPANQTTTVDEFAGSNMLVTRCEESMEIPEWKITAETQEVLGYTCTLATTSFKGREWKAWFALDLPMDAGPWKLRGLPGLILKAEDAEQHYCFTATGFEKAKPDEQIYDRISPKAEKMDRKKYEGLMEFYTSDMMGFMASVTGQEAAVVVSGNNGPEVVTRKFTTPYNPIERK